MSLVLEKELTDKHGVVFYSLVGSQDVMITNYLKGKPCGTFLIRTCTSRANAAGVVQYVTCDNRAAKNLIAYTTSGRLKIDAAHTTAEEVFPTLRQLIKYYETHSITPVNNFEDGEGKKINTLNEYVILPELAKFTCKVTKNVSSTITDLSILPCEENSEVVIVNVTAGYKFGVDKRNGSYGKVRTSRNFDDEDETELPSLEEEILASLYTPPGYDLFNSKQGPYKAKALINYDVPYSNDGSTLMFKKGDLILVNGFDKNNKAYLEGSLCNNKNISGKFPLFSVEFVA